MNKKYAKYIITGSIVLLNSCAIAPSTNVQQPMTARPNTKVIATASGSIFNPTTARSLASDRHPQMVGDTLTIIISESTNAITKSNTNASRSTSINASVPMLNGVPGKSFQGLNIEAKDTNTLSGKGDAAANNLFTGILTVTVIEVLTNGNLVISGEKQIAIGEQTEYIRFSGVVNPRYLTSSNTVNSNQVADARIEYKANGVISEAQMMGWLARFFLNVLPF